MIQAVVERRLKQSEAAVRLGVGVRQVKRLARRFREGGVAGLVSGRRGRRPNNALPDEVRQAVLSRVRERCPDFGPTHACEKLVEEDGFRLSVETLRQWMVADGQWQARGRRRLPVHAPRPRRSCVGDLVQVDGSPHAWFEDRGPRCTLIAFVDDATSRLTALRFAPSETTRAYMETLGEHLAAHGRPVALYSDRAGVFRNNLPGHEGDLTQFTRALKTLDIEPIHASTPQAKGRVERANRTLQGRLVREMRLRGIGDLASGNAFLPAFMADFNARFAVAPACPEDAHRPVLHDAGELALIFSEHHAQGDEEPDGAVRVRDVAGDGGGQGAPAAGCRGDGVQGLRRPRDGAAGGSRAAGSASGRRRAGRCRGGREDGSGSGRRGQGGAAVAAGAQAGAGPYPWRRDYQAA